MPTQPPAAGATLIGAERDWAVVEARSKAAAVTALPASSQPASLARVAITGPKTPAQARVEKLQRAQGYRWLAQGAKDFYTKNPAHPKATEARKIEALAALDGITDDDKAYEQSAIRIAGDYRTDKSNPAPDRYLVAHAVERQAVSKKLHGAVWLAHPAEAEMLADRLHDEFGELPEVYGCYLAVAEGTNCDAGRDVAIRLLQMPAPVGVKAAAQRILDRWRFIRQPLDFPLTTEQGRATTLGKLAGKLTVVVLWDGGHAPAGPPGLSDYKKNLRPNTEWVYVSFGTPAPLAKGAKPSARPPGTLCIEPLGFRSALADKLKITRLPFVLVLDERQNLSGFGRIDELPWLLNGLNRLIAP